VTLDKVNEIASLMMGPLSKRDVFAAAALQGILAHHGDYVNLDKLAEICFKYADAMLKHSDNSEAK
jgi:hypothetical protein